MLRASLAKHCSSNLSATLQTQEQRWEQLYELRFGELTSVVREAARLAKSWKALYRCKLASDKQAEPWMTPCDFELAAMHQHILGEHSVGEPVGGVVFLLDGSGSVFQGQQSCQ